MEREILPDIKGSTWDILINLTVVEGQAADQMTQVSCGAEDGARRSPRLTDPRWDVCPLFSSYKQSHLSVLDNL